MRNRELGTSMVPLFKALRPQQWIKNFFVLAALLFSQHVLDPAYLLRSSTAFFCFCLISSAVYLFNDIQDLENDRQHPEKRHRPIASGQIGIPLAGSTAALFTLIALTLAFRLDVRFGAVILIYGLQNLGYSIRLQHVAILDVMIIATGFLLRAIGGAFAIDVEISSWFILCTMLVALLFGFVKRRQELILLEEGAPNHRRILEEYTPQFLDQAISVLTAGALVAYALYTMSPEVAQKLGTPYLNLTIPCVVYGLLRYLYLVYKKGEGGDPTSTLLQDSPLLITGVLWLAILVTILYF